MLLEQTHFSFRFWNVTNVNVWKCNIGSDLIGWIIFFSEESENIVYISLVQMGVEMNDDEIYSLSLKFHT